MTPDDYLTPSELARRSPARNFNRVDDKRERSTRTATREGAGRDACFNCGTRRDLHAEFGCRTWRGLA